MQVLSFDLSGKFAHFRKFFANNTALSYAIPPRTTQMGMIAAILEWPRDSYYDALRSEHMRLGIQVLHPIKKSFHRLNLLSIKKDSDFRGASGPVQTPVEVITARDLRNGLVVYRIFVNPTATGQSAFDDLWEQLDRQRFPINLSLGTANFSASVSSPHIYNVDDIEICQGDDEAVEIHSAVPADRVQGFTHPADQRLQLEEELLPHEFVADYDRELGRVQRVLFTTDGQPLPIRYTGDYYHLSRDNERFTIAFLD